MVNTKHGRSTSAFWRLVGVLALSVPLGANAVEIVEISNGIPEGTLAHYRVDVATGGKTCTAFITAARFAANDIATSEVVFDYSSLVDTGVAGQGFSLSGSDPVPDPNIPNSVTSSGEFFGVNQNRILWTALSSIAPGAQTMTTQYTFETDDGSALGALRFLQYLDEDVQGAGSDVFSPGVASQRKSPVVYFRQHGRLRHKSFGRSPARDGGCRTPPSRAGPLIVSTT